MSNAQIEYLTRAFWTIGSYGCSLAMRLGSNIILSRLLTPEIVGVMVIVNSIKYGIELLTDVGIEQNIVHNKRGSQAEFLNTAWTLQILRGMFLSLIFLALSHPLSNFFSINQSIFAVMSLAPTLTSLCSTSVFVLVRSMEVRRRNLFELSAETISFCVAVAFALITPTVWALVFGSLASIAIRAALSYRLPHPPYRLKLELCSVVEIVHFGKWIALSSLLIYASTNIDKLIISRSTSLDLLGIYGLARTIADMPASVANRLSYQVVFPAMAAANERKEENAVSTLAAARWKFVLLASIILGSAIAWSDVAIRTLYDSRYHQAGWMLFALLIGAWPAVLSNLSEATLLGFGKPAYSSLSNSVRLIVLMAGVPLGLTKAGLHGAIAAMIVSELCRYAFVMLGQIRIGLTFARQDAVSTVILIVLVLIWTSVRSALGIGVAWNGLF